MIPTPDERYTFMQGDVVEQLRLLPPESVHCVVTSPPYFGLRDYGTATWEGGDAACDHSQKRKPQPIPRNENGDAFRNGQTYATHELDAYHTECRKCGARRIDQAIGLERTLPEYIERMVGVFREVKRVLRKDGTAWVNMGDSYAGGGGYYPDSPSNLNGSLQAKGNVAGVRNIKGLAKSRDIPGGLKPKDLMMVPARLAIALCDDGWYLRSEITWCKRAPMPESCTDRPTSATERIYLLSRSSRYYYDADAVRELAVVGYDARSNGNQHQWGRAMEASPIDKRSNGNGHSVATDISAGRNMWNYFLLGPEPFPEAHFATFPTEIPRRAILAGTSERGCCPHCGAPWRRVTEPSTEYLQVLQRGRRDPSWKAERRSEALAMGNAFGDKPSGGVAAYQTKGWQPTCKCPHTEADVVPAVVLDPFAGAGTTIMVALRLGRRGIGIDLSQKYIDMAERRIQSDPEAMNLRMMLDA